MELDHKDYIENENNVEENNVGGNAEENEEDEQQEREKFQLTITQNIGEDIIQIENYPSFFYYDENNFGDYYCKSNEINF